MTQFTALCAFSYGVNPVRYKIYHVR